MRRQSYPVARLTGGLDVSVDATFLADINSPNIRGVRFDQGRVRKDLGFTQFGKTSASGLPLEGTVMLIDSFPLQTPTIHQLMVTIKWIYKYNSTTGLYEKINKTCTTGELAMTFVAATKKITRGAGSFVTNGFTVGTIITTDATLNPGPFIVVTVEASEIVVTGVVVNEGPVSKTATGVIPFTGDEDNQITSCVTLSSTGEDMFVIANGKDPLQKWNGDDSNFSNLAGWVTEGITAKQVVYFQSCLVGLHTVVSGNACPRQVQWSVVGDVEDVTGTGANLVELAETSDWIVCGVILRGKLFIFKERSIWELVWVGGTTLFKPEIRIDGVGTYSAKSVVNLGESVIFYGSDNVYLYDGLNLTPLGKNIYPWLFDTERKLVSTSKANRACAAYIEELNEYWLCLPSTSGIPDLLFKYSFDLESWVLRDKALTAFGYYSVSVGTTWKDLVGPWLITSDAVALTFDSDAKTITRANGSFVTDGYKAGDVVKTTAVLNPGPFTIATGGVAALVLTLDSAPVDEGPVTKVVSASQDWVWLAKDLQEGAPTTLVATPDSNIWEDDRITKSTDYMCFETKDWMFAHNERLLEFRIQAKGGPFTVKYSLNGGLTWSTTKTFSVSAAWTEYVWWLNLTCQKIRLKIESRAEDLDILWIEPWYIPRERSKGLVSPQ